MIELNEKTRQDFLNREWVQRLLDAGVDMSDAKYMIITLNNDYVVTKELLKNDKVAAHIVSDETPIITPTYSTAELLYKLNEWPSIELPDGKLIGASLDIFKDAPFYFACYYFSRTEKNEEYIKYDMESCSEYPIEALAQLLIASAKSNFHNFKYSKDISSK